MSDSVIRVNKKYYPQTLLKDCKYKKTRNKVENLVNDDLELDTDSEFESESECNSIESDYYRGFNNSFRLPLLHHPTLKNVFYIFLWPLYKKNG